MPDQQPLHLLKNADGSRKYLGLGRRCFPCRGAGRIAKRILIIDTPGPPYVKTPADIETCKHCDGLGIVGNYTVEALLEELLTLLVGVVVLKDEGGYWVETDSTNISDDYATLQKALQAALEQSLLHSHPVTIDSVHPCPFYKVTSAALADRRQEQDG